MRRQLMINWSRFAIAALLGLGLGLSIAACGEKAEDKPATGTEKNLPADAGKASITVECSGCKDTKTIGVDATEPEC